MRIILGIILILCVGAVVALYFVFYKPLLVPKKEPTSISFQAPQNAPGSREDRAAIGIFVNGEKLDLSSSEFLNRSTDAFFVSETPEVIILANPDITWGTFFKTLPISIDNNCIILRSGEKYCNEQSGNLQFFVNNEKLTDFLDKKILDGDRALVSFGQENTEQINIQMQMVANPLP